MSHRPGSWRRQPLPPGWERIRAAVLERDGHACQWPMGGGRVCGLPARDADHKDPDGPQDETGNLWALCPGHHRFKTGTEGGAAWGRVRRAMAAARTRPPERHPGLR